MPQDKMIKQEAAGYDDFCRDLGAVEDFTELLVITCAEIGAHAGCSLIVLD